jgi:signal transduction histidine kinase
MTRRLLLSYLSITAFMLVVLELPLGITFARAERDRLVAAIEHDATVLATAVEDPLEAGATGGLDPVAAGYQDRTGARVVVVDRNGVTVADSDPPAPGRRDLSTRPEIAAALRGRRAVGSRSSATLGGAFTYVAVPVASRGQVHGAVRITYSTSAVDARVRRVWLALAAAGAVVLAVVALVGFALARSMTRPLRALEQATSALARGELDSRAAVDAGPPELRRLAAAFDDMAARLGRLLGAQQAFVADASHQLRTPLTALRLRLENLEPAVPSDDAGNLQAAISETARLTRLVDGLLVLARAEATTPVRREVVDAAAVAADRRAAWAPLAAENGVALTLESGTPAPVWALAGALEQVLDNLLANALRHTPGRQSSPLGNPPGWRMGRAARHRLGPGNDVRPARARLRPVLARARCRPGG